MRSMPAWALRARATRSVTLEPGRWPPSPGLAPWPILISSRYGELSSSLVTPKRPEAICCPGLDVGNPEALGGVTLEVGQRQASTLGSVEVAHPEIRRQLGLEADAGLEPAISAQLVDAHRADDLLEALAQRPDQVLQRLRV